MYILKRSQELSFTLIDIRNASMSSASVNCGWNMQIQSAVKDISSHDEQRTVIGYSFFMQYLYYLNVQQSDFKNSERHIVQLQVITHNWEAQGKSA